MKLATETITLFIPYYVSGEVQYLRKVVNGVSWHQTNKADITTNGLKSADVVTVRIPVSAFPGAYVNHAAFTGDASTFSLKEGMPVLKGAITLASGESVGKLSAIYGREIAKTVLSFTDNRRGKEPHIKVVLE